MAAMFLLRADSFPEEAKVSWTYVVAIVQTPVHKAVADTKWTPRHRVKATKGVTSTSVNGEQARERKREREMWTAGDSISSEVLCWVSRWKSRISNRAHTHTQPPSCRPHTHLYAVKCTVMRVKSMRVPKERLSLTIWKRLDIADQHWYAAENLNLGWFNSLWCTSVLFHVINFVMKFLRSFKMHLQSLYCLKDICFVNVF